MDTSLKLLAHPQLSTILWSFFAILLGLGLTLLVWRLLRSEARLTEKILQRQSNGVLKQQTVADGMDGFLFIDYMLLTPNGIILIHRKDYEGNLFGGEKIDEWTQMVNNSSFKFPNPIYQLQDQISAIRARFSNVPIHGLVLFSAAGRFPRERPKSVVQLDNLSELLSDLGGKGEIARPLREAWENLSKSKSN